ncbi:galactokinase [Geofilum rubicundum]|uniref:Galactokinase n=1 Tax=Geofilum rubicundum JCM 15548 TaxID=1236989 RepID=A0A0E9M201_9BACT|nr:galactokinase [Geofilum rubicundum]GAO31401.1 galactokinase [Geofilum rubicundum JCM 15548]
MDTKALKAQFSELYGAEAEAVFFSPGRVNLIGEHTDYNGGYVFPCALNYGTYLLVRKNADNVVRFASTNLDLSIAIALSDLSIKQPDGAWVNYPLGVVEQFAKKGIEISGLDLLYSGNIPNGAGLSSSASIELVTSVMINDLYEGKLAMMEMVQLSQNAENQFVGVNCGIMDQFAVGMGKANHALALKCDTLKFEEVPLKLDGYKIVISNTNKRRGLADSKYNERRSECEKALEEMNTEGKFQFLSDIDFDRFNDLHSKLSSDVLLRRARHVITENKRVVDAMSALEKNNLQEFGQLMNASHVSLRDDYEVTGSELDALVEEAWRVDGVIGSRMTGAGFGGCTVSIVKDAAVDNFLSVVGPAYEKRTGLKPEFYVAEVGDGARRLE